MSAGVLRVVTPPATEAVSVADLKAHARVTSTAEDAILPRFIRAAREDAEHLTQRSIGTQTLELRIDSFPGAGESIELPRPPVTSVISVVYRDTLGASQTLSPAGYALRDTEAGALLVPATPGAKWPDVDYFGGAVVITYVAGYTSATIPAGTASFILLEAATLYEARESAGEKPVAEHPFVPRLLDRTKQWDI